MYTWYIYTFHLRISACIIIIIIIKYNTYPHFVGEQEIYLLTNTTLNYTTLSCTLEENEHDKKYKVG